MANAADNRALNRFIETSGGGPANIISKMAAYRRKQTGDMQIAASEAKANTQIANAEAPAIKCRNLSTPHCSMKSFNLLIIFSQG